jgi:hypothetical protein
LVFDPINVEKHGLTYTTLSYLQTNIYIYIVPLQHEFFYVDPRIHVKMNRLKTIATWIPLILQLKNLHNSHVIIQALNTTSLHQHYENINHDHNLQMSHILCLLETRIHHASIEVHKFINWLKYSYISIHNGHGLMMMYDIHMHLDSFNTITSDGLKYIAAILIHEKQYIFCVCMKLIHVQFLHL